MILEWKNISKNNLIEYFDKGLWFEEIAEIYDISSRAVRDKTKKFGIELDRKNKKKEKEVHICKNCGKEYITSINEGYCSHNCMTSKVSINEFNNELHTSSTKLGNNIIILRSEGKSYSKIALELNCSKSTVSYHCSRGVKEAMKIKNLKYKKEHPFQTSIMKQVHNFYTRKKGTGKVNMCKDWNRKLRSSTERFINRNNMEVKNIYNYRDALRHIGGINTKCYLTGKEINLETDDYCLDHILPVDKGGNNELENMGVTIPEANASKTNLTVDEYLELCKTVLENFGYIVTK